MRAIVTWCLALALAAAGCSGGEASQAHSDSTPSSGTSAGPRPDEASPGPSTGREDGAVVEVPQPPAGRDDRRGRAAFAEYVLQAWVHALNTNDPQALLAVSGDRPCGGCRQLAAELESRAAAGWSVALEDVRVASSRVRREAGTSRVLLSVSLPASDTFFEDGSYRSTNPAHPRSTFEVEMTYTDRRYRLDAFSLY